MAPDHQILFVLIQNTTCNPKSFKKGSTFLTSPKRIKIIEFFVEISLALLRVSKGYKFNLLVFIKLFKLSHCLSCWKVESLTVYTSRMYVILGNIWNIFENYNNYHIKKRVYISLFFAEYWPLNDFVLARFSPPFSKENKVYICRSHSKDLCWAEFSLQFYASYPAPIDKNVKHKTKP